MEENSPTGEAPATAASIEPTVEVQEQTTPAESVNQQETNPAETQPAESVSDEAANQAPTDTEGEKQTEETGGQSQTDEGLAKFAKSQGFDPENLTDGERKALKIAHDNQKAYRSKAVAESKASVSGDITKDELEQFRSEFKQYQASRQADAFFKEEGRDDALAPVMSQIIEETKENDGPELAAKLASNLNLLYDLARVRQGSVDNDAVEQARREERESINKKLSASSSEQHASQNSMQSQEVVNREWFATTYDPNNPEHLKLRDAYFALN